MYQDDSKNWQAEWIQHLAEMPNRVKLKIIKHKLIPKNTMDLVWLEILKTNIQDLPTMYDIKWKLKFEPEIYEEDGEKRLFWPRTHILDGEDITVQLRNGQYLNQIVYANPEGYLQVHQDVDELIYFQALLDLIRTEFGIWKDN